MHLPLERVHMLMRDRVPKCVCYLGLMARIARTMDNNPKNEA